MNQLWIMGCGDIGRRVASLYQKQGQRVIGWVRSEESLLLGEAQGISMQQGNMDDADVFAGQLTSQLNNADVFWFMPPPRSGSEDSRLHQFLDTVREAPRRIVLISTTGVYGDCAGRWIDESEPLKPVAERAVRRVDAESALQTWGAAHGNEYVILRVPGIYAQDRLPLARLKRGEPVLAAAEAPWTNRIHADDLAMVCKVAMEASAPGYIYNATDGEPSTMTDYFNQVADFAGLSCPQQVSLVEAEKQMSAGMLSYLAESRRIGNDKLLAELGVRLRYPSLRHGLNVSYTGS